ncbi:putative multi-domain containing protein, partial [Aduncisulcus paluster]
MVHKLKKEVQVPNSKFLDVQCSGCHQITCLFSHATTVVKCPNCDTILSFPKGGKCGLPDNTKFRAKAKGESVMERLYGKDGVKKLKSTSILVVGSGGIGIEVVKSFLATPVDRIDLIDLDTIDISNLNRQFFYRPCDVGEFKAKVACDVLHRFNPSIKSTPYQHNVKDLKIFSVSKIQQYSIIINALDNISARQHVNKLCVLAKVPLFDAGSSGRNGNISRIFPYHSSCYSCNEFIPDKNPPVCTIRSKPTEYKHCAIWGKMVYNEIMEDIYNFAGIEEEDIDKWNAISISVKIFNKIFNEDIQIHIHEHDPNAPSPHSLILAPEIPGKRRHADHPAVSTDKQAKPHASCDLSEFLLPSDIPSTLAILSQESAASIILRCLIIISTDRIHSRMPEEKEPTSPTYPLIASSDPLLV